MTSWRPRTRARGLVLGVTALGFAACSDSDRPHLDVDASAAIGDDASVWDSQVPFDDDMEDGGFLGMREDAAAAVADADLSDDSGGEAGGPEGPPNPLAGRYAVRTQVFARQVASLGGDNLDVVSKGSLVSIAEINQAGVVHEEYCFFELKNESVGITSWLPPTTLASLPSTDVALVEEDGHFVRPLAEHNVRFSWVANAPADCVAGETHTSGCLCPENDALPTDPDDCRVRDTDGDGKPGVAMSVGIGATPADADVASSILTLSVVANIQLGWRLPLTAGDEFDGSVSGGFFQSELDPADRTGELVDAFSSILNAMCPDEYGHVELVRGDFTCADLIAARAERMATAEEDPTASQDFGAFDISLDPAVPAHDPEASTNVCPNPDTACGVDTDRDGTPDCRDNCPSDAAKIQPGTCGCGVAETDADGDATPNCLDLCPADPLKIAPGLCTCGVADTNTDGDALPDCQDGCPNDAAKTAPGVCQCGVADTDSDNDGTPNCRDNCPTNAGKVEPGTCGCGTADTDSDRDGRLDCQDGCPSDPNKTAAGSCGCGTADTDSDNDSVPNCRDNCPSDGAKTQPGVCGCGTAETDTDGDRTPDCTDNCDSDPLKVNVGVCGCGTPDTDTDSDGTPNCRDNCPSDGGKTQPGQCGCGIADRDLNGDGSIDCRDDCPADPNKVAPGLCGCGVPDTNRDGDARPDCLDACPDDAGKIAVGQCGCGVADLDSDTDGVANCNDACPGDPGKTTLGACGCGVAETDSDGDGTPNCTDQCPNNAGKVAPGVCGCGAADVDTDRDGRLDCQDACPNDAAKIAAGQCGCGVADTDTDGDGTANCNDQCPANPALTAPGACGCNTCSPIAGTYAMRSSTYSKQKNGNEVTTSKSLNYSLVTISQNAQGAISLSERACWAQSIPNPNESGTKAYSWSKPAWVQAVPLSVQTLAANANGTFTRDIPLTRVGWDPGKQPSACSASSTPRSPWPSAWGSTCRCTAPADTLPPYDTNASGFDCRLVDTDQDGLPGVSAIASTNPPSSPSADPPGLGATAYGVTNSSGRWVISTAANGRLSATIEDTSVAMVVGCDGIACFGLASTPVQSRNCPAALNKAQFIPVTAASDSCSEIIAARDTLFDVANDGAWPTTAACPAP